LFLASLSEVDNANDSTEESISTDERGNNQNFVVCVPKVVPSRPKSAIGSMVESYQPESPTEEDTSEKSEDIDATLKK
jgi:hypothetical protein